MKKISLIIVAILLMAIIISPIIGDKFMQKYAENTLYTLNTHGLKLLTLKTDTSYLNTKKYFKFVVKDSDKFMAHINSFYKLPIQIQPDLNGTVIALDINYSNIPFTKSIKFALYPLELSKVLTKKLKKEDIHFYNQFSAFLKNKGLFYYGEYNLINKKFITHIKDIHEHYTLQNSSDINITLSEASFQGEGNIFTPKKIITHIKTMSFKASQKAIYAKLLLKEFYSQNNFLSWSDYNSSTSFDKVRFIIKGKKSDINLSVDGLKTTSNATIKSNRISMKSSTNLKQIVFLFKKFHLKATKLHANANITNIALKPFKELRTLIRDTSNKNITLQQHKIQQNLLVLFSKGINIKIDNLSLKDIIIKQKNNLGALKIKLDMNVKKDANLTNQIQQSPLILLENVEMETNITLSKKLYNLLLQNIPMAQLITPYAKKEHDNIVFNISFHKKKFE